MGTEMFLLVQTPNEGGFNKLFAFTDMALLDETQAELKEAGFQTVRIHGSVVASAPVNPTVAVIYQQPSIVVLPDLSTEEDW